METTCSFSKKLDRRLNTIAIEEEVNTIIDTLFSNNGFDNISEFRNYLTEGALLNINVLASKALSIPSGQYMVWATDAGTTMLVPCKTTNREVFENHRTETIHTSRLMQQWNKINKILAESEDDESTDGIPQRIDMSTVDRDPFARAMERQGHSETSLADAVGVNVSSISRLLRKPKSGHGDPGGRNPSINLAAKIGNELKSEVESLFPDIFKKGRSDMKQRKPKSNRGSGKGWK